MTQMALAQLLAPWLQGQSVPELMIQSISNHSTQIESGALFLAYKNKLCDRKEFIAQAIERGAVAIAVDANRSDLVGLQATFANTVFVEIEQLAECYGEIAARFYGDPTRDMQVIGVTGTNGKSSTAYFIAQAFNALNVPCAFIGTIGIGLPGQLEESPLTTLDPIACQKVAAEFKQQGIKALAIEMSSHALDQNRLHGIQVNTSVLTQITSDHLDYHQTLENYKKAKERCMQLPGLQKAVLNLDDLEGLSWANKYNSKTDIIGYGHQALREDSQQPIKGYLQIQTVEMLSSGMHITFYWQGDEWSVNVPVIGRFNAENIAATVGVLCAYDFSVSQMQTAIEAIHGTPGRMQCFSGKGKPTVYVDYAHTTDGLAKALQAVREHSNAHLVTVFGCGGDRDATKRAPMGQLAAQYSDAVVLTSDNPRSEDPQQILKQIEQGVIAQGFDVTKLKIESDREKAIHDSILNAKPTDVLLIAGKGHETTQKLDGYTIDCDDRAIVKKALQAYQ